MLYWPRPIILTYAGLGVALGINRSASDLTTRINTTNEAELCKEQLSCDVNLFKENKIFSRSNNTFTQIWLNVKGIYISIRRLCVKPRCILQLNLTATGGLHATLDEFECCTLGSFNPVRWGRQCLADTLESSGSGETSEVPLKN